jgi:predicted CXXCH cytochrome family protein
MKGLKHNIFLFIIGIFSLYLYPQISGHQDWQKLPQRCRSCHVGHGMPNTAMLPIAEEDFCYQCHGDANERNKAIREKKILPTIKLVNIRKEFRKPYHHPVELKVHDTQESFLSEYSVYGVTRSECLDCHRGHGVSGSAYSPGITPKISTKNEKEYQYQLCYKCHTAIIQSTLSMKNIKDWFNSSNPSFHPVEAPGKNINVPSLIKPYTVDGIINCTDCHNNDEPSGPMGPHGSRYAHILEKNFSLLDYISESEQQYDLCYKCHQRESILADQSFPFHNRHIVQVSTSCFTCHHSHGSQRNTHLIKYGETQDPMRIQRSSSGRLEFIDLGQKFGQCFLTCHGVDHNPKAYQNNR